MSKRTLQDTFKSLRDLEVNYDIRDISTEYLKVTNEIDIENYLDYSDSHLKYLKKCESIHKDSINRPGIFHVTLSVKVNKESSRFVPFFSIYSNSKDGLVTSDEREKLFSLGQREIQYDLTTFMSSFFRGFNKDYGCGNDSEVPCCAFTVNSSKGADKKHVKISDLRFLSEYGQSNWITSIDEKPIKDKNLGQKSKRKKVVDAELITLSSLNSKGKGKIAIKALKDALFSDDNISFVKSFSDYYKGKGADTLRYTIYNMDFDFGDRSDCLTRLMIISTEPGEVSNFMLRQLNRIREIVSFIRSRYAFDLIQKNRYETIKSAKSAIISRNLSHNLGSHVMFYIKQRLESVPKILQTGALEDLIKAKKMDEIVDKIMEHGKEMPFLVGLGRFLNYLQERQDFIATVATNHIPYNTIVNFKDAIYDELKPDIRAKRHRYDESTEGRYPANLLLDYIAKSEGFGSSDLIELKFGEDFNGGENPDDVPASLREFNISLPGGNLGRQAVFSIIENIIRNTAKHDGNNNLDGKLRFQFDILNPDNINNIYGCSLRRKEIASDNIDIQSYSRCKNDFFYLGITVILKDGVADSTMEKIREGLRRNYITESDQIDENCKGLKEIRISAAWLRGNELDNLIPLEEPPAVAIRKNGNGHLQYIICLPTPKKVALVTGKDGPINENGCRDFAIPYKDDKKKQKDIADFDIIVCNKKQRKELVYVGSRILEVDNICEYKDKGLDEIYKNWLEQEFPNQLKNVKLSILDGKVSSSVKNKLPEDQIILKGTSDDTLPVFYKNAIVYNTHYQGQALAKNKELFAKAHFVESVSGGTSTDRLIRHDNRDMAWYCKQMSAGLSTVAIFDERLYGHIVPQDGFSLLDIKVIVECYLDETPTATKNDFIYAMASKFNLSDDEMSTLSDTLPDILTLDSCVKSLEFTSKKSYYTTWLYREKGVWAFDIRINPENNDDSKSGEKVIADIVGYNAPPTDGAIGLYSPNYYETVVGRIILTKSLPKVIVCLEPSNLGFECKYDFITIHQGLLDKVYGCLGFHDEWEKEKVTKALFDCFSKSSGKEIIIDQKEKKNEETDYKYFLPKFIIHSGRSKPNHKDMPQHLPFLQFSAIDYAVRDCKYTLTELLYSAHYEQD